MGTSILKYRYSEPCQREGIIRPRDRVVLAGLYAHICAECGLDAAFLSAVVTLLRGDKVSSGCFELRISCG